MTQIDLPPTTDNDKENDNRSGGGQSTQGVIQRRRRPKRRSTGVVHIDMDVSGAIWRAIASTGGLHYLHNVTRFLLWRFAFILGFGRRPRFDG